MSYNPGGRFGGGSDDDGPDRSDRGTGRGGTSPAGPAGVDDPDPAPPEDDDDGGVNPGGRFGGGGGGGGRTGGTGRDPTRSVRETVDVSAGIASPGGIDAPDISGTTAIEEVGRQNLGADPGSVGVDVETERVSIAGDGPLASVDIPGTDTDVGGALDAGANFYQQNVTDPLADVAERDISGDQPAFTPVQQVRGQLAEDAARGAVGTFNIPGAAAAGVRIVDEAALQSEPGFVGGPVGITGAPDRTERQAEAGREAAEAGVEFAQENPRRTAAFAAGGLGAGFAVGSATRGARVGVRGIRAADDVTPTPDTPDTGLGGRGAGSVLDEADIRQPASSPRPSSTVDRIRRDLDDLIGDDRGQLGAGRQRQRPDTGDDVTPDPTTRDPSREIVEGSPRDRISSDITGRQRTDLETSRGTFDAGDAIDPIGQGGRRSTSTRIPRDPLDTSGGRAPSGGAGVGLGGIAGGLGTGAAIGGQLDRPTAGDDLRDFGLGIDSSADDTAVGPDDDTIPDTGVGPDTDTGVTTDTGVGSDTTQRPMQTIRAATQVTGRTTTGSRQATSSGGGNRLTDTALGGGGRGGFGFDGFNFRGRDIPNFPDVDTESDPLRIDEDEDERRFSSGIRGGEELADAILGDRTDRGPFGIDEDEFIGR